MHGEDVTAGSRAAVGALSHCVTWPAAEPLWSRLVLYPEAQDSVSFPVALDSVRKVWMWQKTGHLKIGFLLLGRVAVKLASEGSGTQSTLLLAQTPTGDTFPAFHPIAALNPECGGSISGLWALNYVFMQGFLKEFVSWD